MKHKKINQKTPAGGDYSEIYYMDDNGNIVDDSIATTCIIRECTSDGTLVKESIGICRSITCKIV